MQLHDWLNEIRGNSSWRARRRRSLPLAAQIEFLQDRTMLSGVSDPGEMEEPGEMPEQPPLEEESPMPVEELPVEAPPAELETPMPVEEFPNEEEESGLAPEFDDETRSIQVGSGLIPLTGSIELAEFAFSELDGDTVSVSSIDVVTASGDNSFAEIELSASIINLAGIGTVTLSVGAKPSALAPNLSELSGATVTFTIDDKDGTDSVAISFFVDNANSAPVFEGMSGQTLPQYYFRVPNNPNIATVLGQVSATDADGDAITYSIEFARPGTPNAESAANALSVSPDGTVFVIDGVSLAAALDDGAVTILAHATDIPNSFGVASIVLQLADNLNPDAVEAEIDGQLIKYRARLGALIDAGAARSRATAAAVESDLADDGWNAALTGIASNSLKDIGAVLGATPAGVASYIAGMTLQAAWELRNPDQLPPMAGRLHVKSCSDQYFEQVVFVECC